MRACVTFLLVSRRSCDRMKQSVLVNQGNGWSTNGAPLSGFAEFFSLFHDPACAPAMPDGKRVYGTTWCAARPHARLLLSPAVYFP